MFFYCKTCGCYQDVSLAQVMKDAWNTAMKSTPSAQIPQGYPCPQGHGFMLQLQVGDRISVRAMASEEGHG